MGDVIQFTAITYQLNAFDLLINKRLQATYCVLNLIFVDQQPLGMGEAIQFAAISY